MWGYANAEEKDKFQSSSWGEAPFPKENINKKMGEYR